MLSTLEVTQELAKRKTWQQFHIAELHMLLARLKVQKVQEQQAETAVQAETAQQAETAVQKQQAVRTLASSLSDLAWRPDAGIAQPMLCDFTNVEAVQVKNIPDGSAIAQLTLTPHSALPNAVNPAELLRDQQLQDALARLRHLDLSNNALGRTPDSTAAFSKQLRRHTSGLTFLCLRGNPLQGDRMTFAWVIV